MILQIFCTVWSKIPITTFPRSYTFPDIRLFQKVPIKMLILYCIVVTGASQEDHDYVLSVLRVQDSSQTTRP